MGSRVLGHGGCRGHEGRVGEAVAAQRAQWERSSHGLHAEQAPCRSQSPPPPLVSTGWLPVGGRREAMGRCRGVNRARGRSQSARPLSTRGDPAKPAPTRPPHVHRAQSSGLLVKASLSWASSPCCRGVAIMCHRLPLVMIAGPRVAPRASLTPSPRLHPSIVSTRYSRRHHAQGTRAVYAIVSPRDRGTSFENPSHAPGLTRLHSCRPACHAPSALAVSGPRHHSMRNWTHTASPLTNSIGSPSLIPTPRSRSEPLIRDHLAMGTPLSPRPHALPMPTAPSPSSRLLVKASFS